MQRWDRLAKRNKTLDCACAGTSTLCVATLLK